MLVFLIAENQEDRELGSQAMRMVGLQTAAFKDLDRALAGAEQETINLLIYWSPAGEKSAEVEQKIAQIRHWLIVPILLIVERLTESDHCRFLDLGVDLVMVRPLSLRLLMRYASNLVRRTNHISLAALSPIVSNSLTLDPGNHTVTLSDGSSQHLTQLEFRLLYTLMVNANQVVPINDLIERVWGYSGEGNRDLVRGLIRRLRRKIEPPGEKPHFIHNLPGVGYQFSAPSTE